MLLSCIAKCIILFTSFRYLRRVNRFFNGFFNQFCNSFCFRLRVTDDGDLVYAIAVVTIIFAIDMPVNVMCSNFLLVDSVYACKSCVLLIDFLSRSASDS